MLKNLIGALLLCVTFHCSALVENKDGSVVFSKQELVVLQNNVNALLQQAYQKGVEDGVEAVKSNPKLCPKDI